MLAAMRAPATLLTLVALAAACGRDDCEPAFCAAVACPPPFTLYVTDAATEALVPAPSAVGDVPCSGAYGVVVCTAPGPGLFDVTVSAAGYTSSQVTVVVQAGAPRTECTCERCPRWTPTVVALAPL